MKPGFGKIQNIFSASGWTPQTLVVENATPTNIVMTGSVVNTTAVAGDFTISGFTISSLSRDATNKILTLVLSTSIGYGDILSIVYKGKSYSITNNITHPLIIEDGNTVGWWEASDLTTITKDGSNLVSEWRDKLGSVRKFTAATTKRPTYQSTGILFNGTANEMKTADFDYIQPECIYMVVNQVASVALSGIIDGLAVSTGSIYQADTVGGCTMYPANVINNYGKVGVFQIHKILFNGPSSKYTISTVAVIGNMGVVTMEGITIGNKGAVQSRWSNCSFKELICRKIADTDENDLMINNYLRNKYNLKTFSSAFYGTSITEGTAASPVGNRYTSVYSALDSLDELNYGVTGRTLDNIYTNRATIITKPAYGGYIFFEFGANDGGAHTADPIAWHDKYTALLNYVINTKGWPINKIKMLTTFYTGSMTWQDVNATIKNVGADLGIQVMDTGNNLYNGGDYATFMSDYVHPSNAGHARMAAFIDANIITP